MKQYPYIGCVGNGYDKWEVYEMHRHILRGQHHQFESRPIKLFTVEKEMKLNSKKFAAGKAHTETITRATAYAIAKSRARGYANSLRNPTQE